MTKPTEDPVFRVDQAACLRGGEVAGQYLDSLKKTDLAALTREEWAAFCVKLVGAALLHSVGDVYGDEIPF